MTSTCVDLTKFTITQRNKFQIMKKTQSMQKHEYSILMEVVHWFHICVMGIHKFRQTVNESCNFFRKCESHNMKH